MLTNAAGASRPRIPVLPSGSVAWAVFGYVGVVTLLVGVSSLTQDSVGPALYITAVALTLPTGVLIYPALWMNALAAGVAQELLGLSERATFVVAGAGLFVIFALAAFLNGVLAQYAWRSIRHSREVSRSGQG